MGPGIHQFPSLYASTFATRSPYSQVPMAKVCLGPWYPRLDTQLKARNMMFSSGLEVEFMSTVTIPPHSHRPWLIREGSWLPQIIAQENYQQKGFTEPGWRQFPAHYRCVHFVPSVCRQHTALRSQLEDSHCGGELPSQ